MKIEHNKLVRDNIPSIIENSGKNCSIRVLNDEEYGKELKKKLVEEANEVFNADKESVVEEIADVTEVLEALKTLYAISDDDIESVKEKKALKNGKFNDKLFLEYVEE